MSKLIVDASVSDRLQEQKYPVELCDASGRVLGTFLPAFDSSKWQGTEPHISDEELDRRMKEPGGRTIHEILADMERSK